ncbi:MAG: SLC13 family permease [Thermoanaerobaculia bacterium]
MLPASLGLALVALLFRLVSPSEIRALLDLHLLSLFLVLILAVECLKRSGVVEAVVGRVLSRVRSERALAAAAIVTTGAVSAMVTNDVALLLVVPFTLAFEKVAPDLDPVRVVVLEIQAANLLGCLTPTGNPQNLLLFSRGGFTTGSFFAAQLPWVIGMAAALLALVPVLVPKRALPAPPPTHRAVEPRLATAGLFLLSLQLLAISQAIPRLVPLLAAVPAAALLGKGLLKTDFTLLGVFSALFVGVEGLRRSALFETLDPVALLGATPAGFVLSGALLSQAVSNVPAAILLAPSAAAAGGGALFTALLYGVNAGGCGMPIASLANLIGADLYLRGRAHRAPFWRLFLSVSFALLAVAIALSLALA